MAKWGSKPIEEVLQSAAARITLLELENKRLRDCLAWYADEKNYEDKMFWVDAVVRWSLESTEVEMDNGVRASKALGSGDDK